MNWPARSPDLSPIEHVWDFLSSRLGQLVQLTTSSSPVPLKTRRVGQRCTLNLSRAETSSRWSGVVVRRQCQLRCRPRHLTMVQNWRGPSPKALMY
ncbi:uncharacterized protein TNCV_2729721 [Trichonephila clavipes]|nr:uncharacterized protein TNCV_2729721 [Trichonephila clavipes]